MKTIEQVVQERQAKRDQEASLLQQHQKLINDSLSDSQQQQVLMHTMQTLGDSIKNMNASQQQQVAKLAEVILDKSDAASQPQDGMGGGLFNMNMRGIKHLDVETAQIQGLDETLMAIVNSLHILQQKIAETYANIQFQLPEPKAPIVTVESAGVDLKPLLSAISEVKSALSHMKMPESKDLDLKPIVSAIKALEKRLDSIKPSEPDYKPILDSLADVATAVWTRPMPVATPVTQIDVNPLRGFILTTPVTVTTTPTLLPTTALANRRTMTVYNEDATVTLRIGGSTVTASGAGIGAPVSAGTYSPSFDIGPSASLYGIVASGSISVTVLEVSNDKIGSS